ncbi:tetratricopeptide repeat protein [Arenibacter sp. M-2]|uniref:tetratricopeptide repeat-containing sensor histidine kinase n=1 Tax=Arenibacter sp. M-2 TaxID=3053612 RepID=UPI0025707F7B|nr:tetratricopeptide repeat protein [Arenibacter sp. M-2]MDL5513839.1 tetratricopeptide repeat protein [Arenibacter sp. M-2]
MEKKVNYKFLFLLMIFLQLMHVSCRDASFRSKDSGALPSNDSITHWLSQENSNSNEEYRQNLSKAFDLALQEKNDSLKSKHFSRISYYYALLGDSLQFRRSNNLALSLSKKIRDSNALANNHWDLGSFLEDNGLQDSAYYHYVEAEKIFKSLKDNYSTGRVLYNLARIQSNIKDYTASEVTTIEAIEFFKPLDKYYQLYLCYNNLGSVTNALKEYEKALEYYQKALFYLDKTDRSDQTRFNIINNIGKVYLDKGEYNTAVETFKKVINTDNIYHFDTRLYAIALSNYANSKNKLGDTTEVLSTFKKALRIKDSIHDPRSLANTLFEISNYYLSQKDTAMALQYALRSKMVSEQTGNNFRLLESLEHMARLDPIHAARYTQEYIRLNDSLLREERTTRNKFTRIRFETDEFIEQNELLTRQRQLWIGIAIALFVLAAFILITIDQRRKNQKLRFEQAQQKANQEIFNLLLAQNKKVEEGKQLEKKRISEELHDGILGQMLGIRLILSGLNNKTDSDSVLKRSDLLKKLQGLEEEIRTISHELSRASQEKIHNFIVSIEELVKTIQDSSKIKCHFKYDNRIDWDQLKGDIKINIYRIVQESLQNCIKHAKATKVDLLFESEKEHVRIIVLDNGVGFDQKKGKRGIGLKNINSRLEKLNGTYDIHSKIGQGTKVIVTIPCVMEEQAEPLSV